ncbi:hypothetical protein F8237_01970 [Bradyrhizobium betae]|uniref:Uncharacterized protein n=1 Tax=Bradyrhizobium betae TaxID=244734 RepID=A0A5P6NYP0_9BRAD|nr:hypothetical protein F8237_01970 [Bradyrhizobium betae]
MSDRASDLVRDFFWFDIDRAMINAGLVEKKLIEHEGPTGFRDPHEEFVIRIYCAMDRARRERELHEALAHASSAHAKARAEVSGHLSVEPVVVPPPPDPWRHGSCSGRFGDYPVRRAHTEAEGRRMDDLAASFADRRAPSQRKSDDRHPGSSGVHLPQFPVRA